MMYYHSLLDRTCSCSSINLNRSRSGARSFLGESRFDHIPFYKYPTALAPFSLKITCGSTERMNCSCTTCARTRKNIIRNSRLRHLMCSPLFDFIYRSYVRDSVQVTAFSVKDKAVVEFIEQIRLNQKSNGKLRGLVSS